MNGELPTIVDLKTLILVQLSVFMVIVSLDYFFCCVKTLLKLHCVVCCEVLFLSLDFIGLTRKIGGWFAATYSTI